MPTKTGLRDEEDPRKSLAAVQLSWSTIMRKLREILTIILSPEGYPVTSFADGNAFLRKAGASVPICVFLDVVMPGPSGIQF